MKQLSPLVWTKGTVLTPQHLQAQDRYVDSLTAFHLYAFHSRPYGFRRLEIAHGTLGVSGTVLELSSAEGVLADGTTFSMPGVDPLPEPISLTDDSFAGSEWLDIYLSLPALREGSANVRFTQTGADCRFVAEPREVRDEGDPQLSEMVLFARKNFRLTNQGNWDSSVPLQIARVRRLAPDRFQFDPKFIPPLLDIGASTLLMNALREIADRVGARSNELAAVRAYKNSSLADFHASDAPSFWLLHTLNSNYPLLRFLLQAVEGSDEIQSGLTPTDHGAIHPEELYTTLSGLASSLMAFSTKVDVGRIPDYNHRDAGACFVVLIDLIRELLEVVVPRRFVTVRLTQSGHNLYSCGMDDSWLDAREVYLSVFSRPQRPNYPMSASDLITRILAHAKVAARARAAESNIYSTSAIALVHRDRASISLSLAPEPEYFQLAFDQPASAAEWQRACSSRAIEVRMPPPDLIPNPELELVIVLPSGQGTRATVSEK